MERFQTLTATSVPIEACLVRRYLTLYYIERLKGVFEDLLPAYLSETCLEIMLESRLRTRYAPDMSFTVGSRGAAQRGISH